MSNGLAGSGSGSVSVQGDVFGEFMERWYPRRGACAVSYTHLAMAAFGIALAMHVATNLLHLRADLLRRPLAVDDLERWHTDWLHSTLGQAASVA